MSTTLGNLRFRVRERLRETDSRRASFDPIEVDQAIADAYVEVQGRMPPIKLYTASAFTIAAGAQTFTLPTAAASGFISTQEHAGEVRIRLQSTGDWLTKRTREEIYAFRAGVTTTTGEGRPSDFALYEDQAQVVQGECWPRANAAEVCDLMRSLMADDLRDHPTDMETATIMMSRLGATALVLYSAADLLQRLREDDAALRRLNRETARDWRARAEAMLYEDEARHHDIESIGRTMRVVG